MSGSLLAWMRGLDYDPTIIGKRALDLTNAYRKSKGLSVLKWSDRLAEIGRSHSKDMAEGRVPVGHEGVQRRFDR